MKFKKTFLLISAIPFLVSCGDGQKKVFTKEEISITEFLSIDETQYRNFTFYKINVYCNEEIIEGKKKTEDDSVIIYSYVPFEIAEYETNKYANMFYEAKKTYSSPSRCVHLAEQDLVNEYSYYKCVEKTDSRYNPQIFLGTCKKSTLNGKTITEKFEYESGELIKYVYSEKEGNSEKRLTFKAAYFEFGYMRLRGYDYED